MMWLFNQLKKKNIVGVLAKDIFENRLFFSQMHLEKNCW